MSVFTKGRLMRITAEEKIATRKRILDAAKSLFRSKGFDQATTRDIAKEVGIATGTMFNYFRSKEAIAVELAAQAMDKGRHAFDTERRAKAKLDEDLFLFVATQLRHLRPLRKYVRPLLESVLVPAAITSQDSLAAELRSDVRERILQIFVQHGIDDPSPIQISIFWSLYVGVVSFWSHDKSPKQEDSLALLDQSIHMYFDWLSPE